MSIDWTLATLRLQADPMAVARQARALPPVALCLLRLLDGHKTLQDTLRLSPVDEETARAVLRRLTELGLARPVGAGDAKPESRVEGISAPLRAWLATPRRRHEDAARAESTPRIEAGLAVGRDPDLAERAAFDDLLAELTAELDDPAADAPPPGGSAGSPEAPAILAESAEVGTEKEILGSTGPAEPRMPSSLQEALARHLAPEVGTTAFEDADLAFFDSYVPESPMTDTFSDLVSAPRTR